MQHSITLGKNDTPKFIADCHLGKLAKYMRLMGLDTLFFPPHIEDNELIHIANDENRIILTRDHHLSQRKKPLYFFWSLPTPMNLMIMVSALIVTTLLKEYGTKRQSRSTALFPGIPNGMNITFLFWKHYCDNNIFYHFNQQNMIYSV